jgi:hypothetical protein
MKPSALDWLPDKIVTRIERAMRQLGDGKDVKARVIARQLRHERSQRITVPASFRAVARRLRDRPSALLLTSGGSIFGVL